MPISFMDTDVYTHRYTQTCIHPHMYTHTHTDTYIIMNYILFQECNNCSKLISRLTDKTQKMILIYAGTHWIRINI